MDADVRGTAHGWNVLPSTGSTWVWSAWGPWGNDSGTAPSEDEAARRAQAALRRGLAKARPTAAG